MAKFTLTIADATKEEILELFNGNIPQELPVALADKELNVLLNEEPEQADAATTLEELVVPQETHNLNAELDTEGLPWDSRINTTNKGKTAKGVWKRRPRLEDAEYIRVRNELKGMTVPTAPAFTPPTVAPVAVPTFTPPVAAPVAPTFTPPTAAPVARDFSSFMVKINELFTKLGNEAGATIDGIVNELNQDFTTDQIANITQIQSNPVLVENAWKLLERDGHA